MLKMIPHTDIMEKIEATKGLVQVPIEDETYIFGKRKFVIWIIAKFHKIDIEIKIPSESIVLWKIKPERVFQTFGLVRGVQSFICTCSQNVNTLALSGPKFIHDDKNAHFRITNISIAFQDELNVIPITKQSVDLYLYTVRRSVLRYYKYLKGKCKLGRRVRIKYLKPDRDYIVVHPRLKLYIGFRVISIESTSYGKQLTVRGKSSYLYDIHDVIRVSDDGYVSIRFQMANNLFMRTWKFLHEVVPIYLERKNIKNELHNSNIDESHCNGR
jgi:hypothetical protein